MDSRRSVLRALLSASLCCAMLSLAGSPQAASFVEFFDPNPASGNQFGQNVLALSTGNVVITSNGDDAGGVNAGAVYLFNGATGALISTLRGSSPGDAIGFSVIALTNGNYVIRSPVWNNGGAGAAGAVTWGSGTTGVNGVVSAANSLVGGAAGDNIGLQAVTALSNGNYVVQSPYCDNGAVVDAGAVTWGDGTTGTSGVVSAANSLVGSTLNDNVGLNGVTALSNGNYVVRSLDWNNGAVVDPGAVTWGDGTTGVTGVISAANSLVGSTANDDVGSFGITALSNGNYVVSSSSWDNGGSVDAGAVTWGNGTTGVSGAVSAANSLVGTGFGNSVGSGGVTALPNGNYVVRSANWDVIAIANVGAVTWGSGTTGVSGAVSAANSLVGSTANDQVGLGGVTVLSNGNYVVRSALWDNGVLANVGAVTWASGTTGVSGAVSAANSLVGSTASDQVGGGGGGVAALSNGNYVVRSPSWDDGAVVDAGAATWADGTTGLSGAVSAANSLVGSTPGDAVGGGAGGGVAALSNGNYVVHSPTWDDVAVVDVGAATWGDGATGLSGAVSAANSLVGSTASDQVGSGGVTPLTNGNYVVRSPNWDNGAFSDAGAATWADGSTGLTGAASAANSLVGSRSGDVVSGGTGGGVKALTNGNYVVASPEWANGVSTGAGAATWGNGAAGVTGVISAANSLIGLTVGDRIGNGGVTALSNGDYVVATPGWDKPFPQMVNSGAATWGSGTSGVSGLVSDGNSVVGATSGGGLQSLIEDSVNGGFIARFTNEPGGRIRVGPHDFTPEIVSVVDVPDDPGGRVALTFNRSSLDDVSAYPPPESYGVWRKLIFDEPARAGKANGRNDAKAPGALPSAALPRGPWVLVATVTATQQAQYVVRAPTSSDAVPNDFVVAFYTDDPTVWFGSGVATGQSENNHQTTAVDEAAAVAFALHGVHPNPARGNGLRVAFALPSGAPARLELLDVSGRLVKVHAVGSMGAGSHAVDLAEDGRVPPGLYWVRLVQGANLKTRRVAVIE